MSTTTPRMWEPLEEPGTLYRVEPLILGPDGWMVFENPSPAALEKKFSEGSSTNQGE